MTNFVTLCADNLGANTARRAMSYAYGTFRQDGCELTAFRPSSPLCTPARAAFLTGQYALHNGVADNGDTLADETDALPTWLSSVNCYGSGKQYEFTLGMHSFPGFDTQAWLSSNWSRGYSFFIWNGSTNTLVTGQHQADYLLSNFTTWLATATEPFFAWINPAIPHGSLDNAPPIRTKWRAGNADTFWSEKVELELRTDTTDDPSWIQSRAQPSAFQQAGMRRVWRDQCRSARDVDYMLEGIVTALSSEGFLDDTVVAFWSDNGLCNLGQHRIGYPTTGTDEYFATNNNALYEEVALVPCIIRGPGFTAGSTIAGATSVQDLTATCLDIFGASATVSQDGQSLLDPVDDDRAMLLEAPAGYANACQGVSHKDYKYIRYIGETEHEYFDLTVDPFELSNEIDNGAYAAAIAAADATLDALIA